MPSETAADYKADVSNLALEANVETHVTNSLNTYDPPTKAEMDSGFAGLNDPTAATIADTGWDEAKADHTGAGSFGEEVQAHSLSTEISALNDISVADIIAGVADGSYDLQEMMRIIMAATAGKSSGGGGSTITFRDTADTKNRISATVDANGNRTAVTLDGS